MNRVLKGKTNRVSGGCLSLFASEIVGRRAEHHASRSEPRVERTARRDNRERRERRAERTATREYDDRADHDAPPRSETTMSLARRTNLIALNAD
ncbi:hypothetical protein VNO80_19289 [Phaseolus coccineus]|uniref:Uncharacterized protein n=1 Tax=Phaseolus coccineus TaxID=3886 RepID=A0AAN9QZM8_PHACN